MIATPCPPPSSLLLLSSGRLAETESDVLLEHIDQCDTCRDELQSMKDDPDWLLEALRSPDATINSNYDQEQGYRIALARALGAIEHLGTELEDLSAGWQLPQKIGEYEIICPLGRGGMGHVYLARHTKLGRDVALKLIASHRLNSPQSAARFEAEMRAVGKLSHPNIVTAHDAREIDGTALLVTEYIDGLDLADIVRRVGPLPIADACEIGRITGLALDYISKEGFVHRDVKPSNIMLSSDGQLKLLDLGLARYIHHEETTGMTGTGQIMGTLDYAAPEQITGSSEVDLRSDVYSLGCTLYHLFTGYPPFDKRSAQTPFAKMTAQVSETPVALTTVLPNAPANLVALLASMLSKSPNQRPQSGKEIAQRLAEHTSQSDLKSLVEKAREQEPIDLEPRKAVPALKPLKPATSPFFKRTIPYWAAIAAGLFGLVLGVFLGIVITITKPDGSKITMQVPEGSSIDIQDSSGVAAESAGQPTTQTAENQSSLLPQPITTVTPDMLSPMAFAVTVEPEDIAEEQLNEAITALRNYDGKGMLETPIGIWCPLDDSAIDVNVNATHNGKRYTLIRRELDGVVPWQEMSGKIGVTASFQGRTQQLSFSFSDSLADNISIVTKKNLLSHLAVIVDGEIIVAPKIVSPITRSAVLTGNFNREKIQYLMQALSGLVSEGASVPELILSLPQETSSPGENSKPTAGNNAQSSSRNPTLDLSQASLSPSDKRFNLVQIGEALRKYLEVYGKFPRTQNTHRPVELDDDNVSLDADVKPYSWRVALLPYLGHEELFAEYDFTRDWDSKENAYIAFKMPSVFQRPQTNSDVPKALSKLIPNLSIPNTTPYVMIDDERSAADQAHDSIADGPEDTLLVAEARGQALVWTSPNDVTVDELLEHHIPNYEFRYITEDGELRQIIGITSEDLRKRFIRND